VLADAAAMDGAGRPAAISWRGLGYTVTPRVGLGTRLLAHLRGGRSAPSAAAAGASKTLKDRPVVSDYATGGGGGAPRGDGGDAWAADASSAEAALTRTASPPAATPGTPLPILSNVDGAASAGELVWVMGASGSGKTTLLDALAGRLAGPLTGALRLDGVDMAGGRTLGIAAYSRRIKYVGQEDALHGAFTVRETLRYAARFGGVDAPRHHRCHGGGDGGGGSPPETVDGRVEAVLDTLGLRGAADTKVGGTFCRGLSRGQKRRLSVGCQLVARPDLLVLDEPLSGLDSYATERVATHLRAVAVEGGTAVVASLHNPSVEVFGMAHRLCLLATGRVVYFGPPAGAADYFAAAAGRPLAPHRSVPEALLRAVNPEFGGRSSVDRLCYVWAASKERAALVAEGDAAAAVAAAATGAPRVGASVRPYAYALPWAAQVAHLAHRVGLDALRNPAIIWLRFAMYLALAVLIGLAWLRVPTSADRIQDILGALFFAQAFFVFMSIAALPSYLEEKIIVTTQRAAGWYSTSAYLVAHGAVEAAFLAALSLICCTVVWGMVGLNTGAGRWAYFVLIMWVSLLTAESLILLVASIVPFLMVGLAAGSFFFGFCMVVQGYFTRVAHLGPLRWARWLSLHGYALGGFVANEFAGRVYAAAPDAFPAFPTPVVGDTVVAALELPSTNRGVCAGVLLGMAVLFRVAAWAWIATFHQGKK